MSQLVDFCLVGYATSTIGSAFSGKLNDKLQLVGFCPVGAVHPATYNNILSNELRCWINSILAFVMIK